jgi:hypothetical protein
MLPFGLLTLISLVLIFVAIVCLFFSPDVTCLYPDHRCGKLGDTFVMEKVSGDPGG